MTDIATEIRELDESFINFDEKSAPIVFRASDMLLQKVFELPIRVTQPGSTILYSFSTVQGDVSFAAYFLSVDSRPQETVIEPHRVPSDVENITGRFKAGREGTLVIKFDNSFSWFTPKYLTYLIELNQPSGTLADSHRCNKSRALLTMLVEETPRLSSELLQSMKESSSIRSEMLDLEVQMKQLQLQLEEKKQALQQAMERVIYIENKMESNKDRKLALCIRCSNKFPWICLIDALGA